MALRAFGRFFRRNRKTQHVIDSIARIARHSRTAPIVAFGYSLVVVILGLTLHVMGDLEAESDFFEAYVVQARSFLDGTIVVDPYRGPLYPIALGLLYLPLQFLGLGLFESGIVLSAASAGVILLLTYRLLERLFSPEIAFGATLLVATNWIFFRYSYTTGNDMFFAAVATACFYAFMNPARSTWKRPILGGVLAGLAYLTRYNGIAIPVALLAGILLLNVWRYDWSKRALAATVFLAAFLAIVVPWMLYSKGTMGEYVYNHNYKNVAYGFYMTTEETTEAFLSNPEHSFDGLMDVIAHDPGLMLRRIPVKLLDHSADLMARVVSWPIAVFILIGLGGFFCHHRTRHALVYFLAGALFYYVLALVFYADRFLLLLIPMLASLAVLGVQATSRMLESRAKMQPIVNHLLLMLIAYSLFSTVMYNKERIRGADIMFRTMGEEFVRDAPIPERGTIVAARKAYFGYFAGLRTVGLPSVDSHDGLMQYLHGADADYLLFSFVGLNTRRPLSYLAHPGEPHPGLIPLLVERNTTDGSFGAVLYRVELHNP